jgi:hypothetical protein
VTTRPEATGTILEYSSGSIEDTSIQIRISELDAGLVDPRIRSGQVQIFVCSGGSGRVKKFEYFFHVFRKLQNFARTENCNENSTYLVSRSGRVGSRFCKLWRVESGRGQASDGPDRQK